MTAARALPPTENADLYMALGQELAARETPELRATGRALMTLTPAMRGWLATERTAGTPPIHIRAALRLVAELLRDATTTPGAG